VSDKNDFERLLENKQWGLKYPVKLKKKIKVAIGGPYGFENLLSQEHNNLIIFDESGLWCLVDLVF